jgi:hypothetical protein
MDPCLANDSGLLYLPPRVPLSIDSTFITHFTSPMTLLRHSLLFFSLVLAALPALALPVFYSTATADESWKKWEVATHQSGIDGQFSTFPVGGTFAMAAPCTNVPLHLGRYAAAARELDREHHQLQQLDEPVVHRCGAVGPVHLPAELYPDGLGGGERAPDVPVGSR